MTKPPAQKQEQKRFHTMLRLPPELADEIKAAAERHGHSMNAEIIARLQASPMDAVMAELADLKRMLRTALDQL